MERDDVKAVAAQKVTYGTMSEDDVRGLFAKFKSDFGKNYDAVSDTEDNDRFIMFKKNLKMIDNANKQNPLALFGITLWADESEEERGMRRMSKKTSGWANMKSTLPNSLVEAAEKGPEYVMGKTFSMTDTSSRGMDMSIDTAQVEWADEDMCAACNKYPGFKDYSTDNRPDDFDWRELGAVTDVKNQKYCGSCWTFSTAGDVEGTHYLSTGVLKSFSEQQLVACDTTMYGCEGGYMYAAMQYVSKIGGLVTYDDYPYEGIMMDYMDNTPTCDTELISDMIMADNANDTAHIESWQFVAMGEDYEDLMATVLLKNGPLSLAINAIAMDYYVHGITGCETIAGSEYCEAGSIDDTYPCDPESLDHGVLAVAYGVQDDVKYWVIKNSWGDSWGEDGYYRIERGTDHCGVANMVQHTVYKEN